MFLVLARSLEMLCIRGQLSRVFGAIGPLMSLELVVNFYLLLWGFSPV